MIANYHTHTPRCKHAQGKEEEYVRCAIHAGLQTLGFSDHTPYPFPPNYTSGFRMAVEELPGYADAVRTVQKQFSDQIDIHLGVEAEFYPNYFADMVSLLKDNGVEYMILGQHLLGNEVGESYLGIPHDESGLERYCDQSIEAMYTGLFTYFAHPDLIHYQDDWKFYQETVRPMCAEAKSCGVPLEINLLGIREGRHYPNRYFWEMAAEEGCDVILGCDAHAPLAMLDTDTESRALELGHRCILCYTPQLPKEAPSHLLLPDAGVAFLSENREMSYGEPCFCQIDLDSTLPPMLRRELDVYLNLQATLCTRAVSHLREAKRLHDRMEQLCKPFVNFSAITALTQKTVKEIFG